MVCSSIATPTLHPPLPWSTDTPLYGCCPQAHNELLSSEGFRADGRRANELRRIALSLHNTADTHADAYVHYTQGNTQLVCSLVGPYEQTDRQRLASRQTTVYDAGSMQLDINITIPAYCTPERRNTQRQSRFDRTAVEYSRLLSDMYAPCIDCKQYPDTQLSLYIHVLHNNGSLLACMVNAVTAVLLQAGITMRYTIYAVNLTVYNNTVVVDMNSNERTRDRIDVTVAAAPNSNNIVAVHYNNGQTCKIDQLSVLFQYAGKAIDSIHALVKQTINEYNTELLQARISDR